MAAPTHLGLSSRHLSDVGSLVPWPSPAAATRPAEPRQSAGAEPRLLGRCLQGSGGPSASWPTEPRDDCFFKISMSELGNCVADCSNHHDPYGQTYSPRGHQSSSLNVPRGTIWPRQRYPFIWIDRRHSASRSAMRPADRLVAKAPPALPAESASVCRGAQDA